MIARQLTFLYIYKVLKLLNASVLFFFFLALLWIGWQLFRGDEKMTFSIRPLHVNQIRSKPPIRYELIGEGALKICSELKSFPLPDLKREMRFLGKNTRPDATIYDLLIHIGLKGSGQSLKVVSGQKLYLTYVEGLNPYLKFSPEPTPLWIMPHLSETGETLVELGVRLLTSNNEKLVEEKKTFEIEDLLQKEAPAKKDPLFEEALHDLEKGNWWDPDHLFAAYGGNEYQRLKNYERLELICREKPAVIHVKQGDCLVWKAGNWMPSQLGKESRGMILAHAKCITPQQMEWELWSADGLEFATFSHAKEHLPMLNLHIEEVFSRIRQRTASRVSCRIENKATILKAGDWVLHTLSGWRVLRSLQEIEEVLAFQSKGELFIFDGIEKIGGNPTFSGTLFNVMRTQWQPVQIPIAMQTKPEHLPHKRKAISSKIRVTSPEEDSDYEPSQREEESKHPRKKSLRSQEGLE